MDGVRLLVAEKTCTLLGLDLRVPPDWTVRAFRFAGKRFSGGRGALEISPDFQYVGRAATAELYRGAERQTVVVRAERIGPIIPGAALQDAQGQWCPLDPNGVLDTGKVEGRALAIRWNSLEIEEPWLTLGDQPVAAHPQTLRIQRLNSMGESLQLRSGLMNEDRTARMHLATAMYSSGLLAAVNETAEFFELQLSYPIELAEELRVWSWEADRVEPRILDDSEVELERDARPGDAWLRVLKLSVDRPIGWALGLVVNGGAHVSIRTPRISVGPPYAPTGAAYSPKPQTGSNLPLHCVVGTFPF